MSIEIVKPGLLTTLQDTGRLGFRKSGIIVSGAMDILALRIANILVGNTEHEAAFEVTMLGPKIHFLEDHLIAITGADLSPSINNEPVHIWRPIYVRKGSLLEFGSPVNGCRAYIAIAGGLAIPVVMESKSTYLHARIGGWQGRVLQAGDVIPCQSPGQLSQRLISEMKGKKTASPFVQANWTIDPQILPPYTNDSLIRIIKGPEYELFSEESKRSFWHSSFLVTAQSDRMGYRIAGPALLLNQPEELLSSAVTFGTIQVPPAGNPIVLMADHPTTGGYPRIAQVSTAYFSTLAQIKPGSNIRFREISLKESQQLLFRQEEKVAQIKRALAIKALHPGYPSAPVK